MARPICQTCGGDGELAEPLGDCPDCDDEGRTLPGAMLVALDPADRAIVTEFVKKHGW